MQSGRSQYSIKLLQKQLKSLIDEGEKCLGLSAGTNDDQIDDWNIIFEGPKDSVYQGGYFQVKMKFPQDYPNSPPEMIFKTKMWHPNIYPDGKVCISILHAPGVDQFNEQEKENEKWSPVLTPFDIIISVVSMLLDPNINSPANIDAAKHFRDSPEDFQKKVRRMAQESLEQIE